MDAPCWETIDVLLEAIAEGSPVAVAGEAPPRKEVLMSPRIIVVDDDLATLALLHDVLVQEGYRTACANNAEAGLCATRQGHTDLN
jgi:PleD family two-component response regulator